MIEYVLYATKQGDEDWEEDILGVDTKPVTAEQFEEMKQILATKGYDRVRIAAINLAIAPDFAGTVNVR